MTILDSHTFPLSGQQLIEASAGTGKTYTISNLYLRLLLGRDPNQPRPLQASEILVLTFTIAATDELRDRIRNRVNLARSIFAGEVAATEDEFIARLMAESTDLATDRRLLTATLQTMDEAAIFTIHGFCARILGEQSFDTGMLFNQNLDGDRDQLLEMAAEDCFRQNIMTLPGSIRNIALKRWSGPEALVKFVQRFLFRHNLQYLPPHQDIDEPLSALFDDIRRCKKMWLDDDVTALVASSNFWGGRLTVTQLKPEHPQFIEDYCRSDDVSIERWEPWTRALLEKNSTKKTVMPDHEIFELIDDIWARQHLLKTVETNLCHLVRDNVKTNMNRFKTQFGQLTLDDLLVEVHRALAQSDPTNVMEHNLSNTLRQRWPVAMIDEFQDTDDLQFEIFTRIYASGGLFFIGDPKQAIYNFRGADVYTYINAKQSADNTFTLSTNWRSTPAMIAAVNHLFNQTDIFGDDKQIPFEPVSAAPPNMHKSFTIDGQAPPPMPIFVSDADNKDQHRERLMAHAAEETVQLLHLSKEGRAKINDKPITPGQIAFLVRQWQDAKAARRALADRNVRSVYVTLESVMLSDTAADLKLLLEAVVDPTNEMALKSALGTRLMQTPASEIAALNHDWSALHQVMEEFQEYHQRWASLEIAPMIDLLMTRRRIPENWLMHQDGERQMTNLRHLAEILQTRAMVAPGMRRLLKWFGREKLAAERVAVDERQLRLESDQDLVQIVTMHAAKGLEYDIVMIPNAGFGEPRSKERDPLFHVVDNNGNYQPAIDFSTAPESLARYHQEDFSETMRLLYVAITRARYRCYLGVPLVKEIKATPIAALLKFSADDADADSALNALPEDLFATDGFVDPSLTRYEPKSAAPDLIAPPAAPFVSSNWRMHSYTGLTRLLKHDEDTKDAKETVQPRPGFGDDDSYAANDSRDGTSDLIGAGNAISFSRFTFPRGSRIGIVLHDFMERLDFIADDVDIRQQAVSSLLKMGLEDASGEWQDVLVDWFHDIVRTPLINGFCLLDVTRNRRLDEMEFHFPVNADQTFLDHLQAEGVLHQEMTLDTSTIQGMMTGYVDLILEHAGQYYLLDYKSNDLGPTQLSYASAALQDAVQHHHYDLQYLIYCVALNRYLKQRRPDYEYDQHFGGVCYLFMRGMDASPGAGVYFDKPEKQLIEALDGLLCR
ncbi:MAG: exodeoxyribonuclease V beta subunit [Candidatus Azotimanducaceae bacterium]|jgi:exodeoxyribonuclease V beta subunit